MKTTIAALFIFASLTTKAQDFQAASLHLDMAGKQHQAATIAPLVTVALAAMIYAGANGNEQATTAATMIGGRGPHCRGIAEHLSRRSPKEGG